MSDTWYDELIVYDPMPVITAEDSEEVKQWKRQLLQKIKEEENVVTLYNVIDTRTGNFHPVAIVKEKNARWFIPALLEETGPAAEPETEAEPKAEPAPKKSRSKSTT